jgi:hypothetical protein
MNFLNYLWDVIKRYLLKSKNTKPNSEIDIMEEMPFTTKDETKTEYVINFNENDDNKNNSHESELVPIKIYLTHTMNERLGPNDFCIGYEKIEKDIKTIVYL